MKTVDGPQGKHQERDLTNKSGDVALLTQGSEFAFDRRQRIVQSSLESVDIRQLDVAVLERGSIIYFEWLKRPCKYRTLDTICRREFGKRETHLYDICCGIYSTSWNGAQQFYGCRGYLWAGSNWEESSFGGNDVATIFVGYTATAYKVWTVIECLEECDFQ